MRRAMPFLAALTCAAQSPEVESLAQAVDAKVLAWRRDFHANPELGNRELRTSAKVAEHLRALGLEVRTGVAKTGVVALLKGGKPGPRLALRADMDALPVAEQVDLPFASKATGEYRGEKVGVMHACGHDAHTAILMGVAEALAARKASLAGEVLFLFQPAEEGAPEGETGGAERMLKEGVFADRKPEAVMGLHVMAGLPAGQLGYRSGALLAAVDDFRVVVRGRQTHGAKPWGGIDPIVAAAGIVTSAQSIVSRRLDLTAQPAVLTFGAFRGGLRSNIIPDEVELLGTLRTFDPAQRRTLIAELTRVVEHGAAAHGASATLQVPFTHSYPVTLNDPGLTARVLPSLRRVAGEGALREVPAITGAEDFAFYAQAVPGFFFFVGATPAGQDPATSPSNHSPKFFLDESALKVGVRALLQVSMDFLGTKGR